MTVENCPLVDTAALLHELLDQLPEAIFLRDAEGRFLYANAAQCALLGKEGRADVLGKGVAELVAPPLAHGAQRNDQRVLTSDQPQVGQEKTWHLQGKAVRLLASYYPVRGEATAPVAVGGLSRRVGKLAEYDEMLRHALSHARCLLWQSLVCEWPLTEEAPPQTPIFSAERRTCLFWNTHFLMASLSLPWLPLAMEEDESFVAAYLRARHPDDAASCDAVAYDALRRGDSSYQTEFRIRLADGSQRWLREEVRIEAQEPGRWRLVGVCTDVTEWRLAQERRLQLLASGRCLIWTNTATRHPVRPGTEDVDWAEHQDTLSHGCYFRWSATEVLDEEVVATWLPLERVAGEGLAAALARARPEPYGKNTHRLSAAALLQGVGGYQNSFPVRLADGGELWLREEVRIEALGEERWRLVGICTDATEGLQASERLQRVLRETRCILWHADVRAVPSDAARPDGLDWQIEVLNEAETWRRFPVAPLAPSFAASFCLARRDSDRLPFKERVGAAIRAGQTHLTDDSKLALADGGELWLHEQVYIEPRGEGRWRVDGILTDVTGVIESRERLRKVMDGARCLIGRVVADRVPLEAAPAKGEVLVPLDDAWALRLHDATMIDAEATHWLPITRTEPGNLARDFLRARFPEDVSSALTQVAQAIRTGQPAFTHEFRVRLADGETRWLREEVEVRADGEARWVLTGVAIDITDRKNFEARLVHQTRHDPLTGLLNRLGLFEVLGTLRDSGQAASLLFLDLDHFKVINDSVGHLVGDGVLMRVAARLRRVAPDGIAVRLGGDEFTVLLPGQRTPEELEALAARVAELVGAPMTVGGRSFSLTASIGIASGEDRNEVEFLRCADMAMYQAKNNGRGRWAFYDATMGQRARERFEMEADLRRALDGDEIRPAFQPIHRLATLEPVACEALARWRNVRQGDVSPERFVAVAEETGLIVPMGLKMLRAACASASQWRRLGQAIEVCVNLSSRQLRDGDLVQQVAAILEESGLPSGLLTLEITESVMMTETDFHADLLESLRALGVRLYIDDFGTGYSSMSYLSRLPVQGLKIDRSFVQRLDSPDAKQRRDTHAIARAIVALAGSLDVDVVAEGIETQAQYETLCELGVALGQGYWFAPALSERATFTYLQGACRSAALKRAA